MKTILHKAESRGSADWGWLHTWHSFSFSDYYDPEKMGFGLLRVLNDDFIEPEGGFGTHPHNNMEIISIILKGALEHKDSMGTGSVIREGEIQVMSAGTGVTHSEFNPSKEEATNLIQLWIFPKERNIRPRYAQKKFPLEERLNQLKTIVSGNEADDSIYIHQDAAVSLGNLNANNQTTYKIIYPGNVAYLFVFDGSLSVDGQTLNRRDALGIIDTDEFTVTAGTNADFMIIEAPTGR